MIHEHSLFYKCYKIVQVDLKFPPTPFVFSSAKDLISQITIPISLVKSLFSSCTVKSEF